MRSTQDSVLNVGFGCKAWFYALILLLPGLVNGLSIATTWAGEAPGGAKPPFDPLAQADERIMRIRRAPVSIEVRDAVGGPVAEARVGVYQKRHAFLFGANIFTWSIPDPQLEEAYRQRFADLLNYATLPFYWWMYEPRPGEPQYEQSERVAQWCCEHGIVAKGHPLAWNFVDPPWLPDDLGLVRKLQWDRVEACVSRFKGLIDRWDVVNEAVHFDRDECFRRAPKLSAVLKETGRVEWTRECFIRARKASADAFLLINDYRTDPAYEELISRLTDEQGAPLYDAIGIQSHMHGGVWPPQRVWEVCERFARFGKPLHFTETTILSGERRWDARHGSAWPSTPEGERQQAKEVVEFYTVLFSHPSVEAITWWDFADYRAWKGAPAGLLRVDMSPKPAYSALFELVRKKWWTDVSLNTDADGRATTAAFYGDYEIVVEKAGKRASLSVKVEKAKPNHWMIELK